MSRFGDLIRGTAPTPKAVEAPARAAPAAPEPVAAPTPPVEAVKPADPAPLKSAAPKRTLRIKK